MLAKHCTVIVVGSHPSRGHVEFGVTVGSCKAGLIVFSLSGLPCSAGRICSPDQFYSCDEHYCCCCCCCTMLALLVTKHSILIELYLFGIHVNFLQPVKNLAVFIFMFIYVIIKHLLVTWQIFKVKFIYF